MSGFSDSHLTPAARAFVDEWFGPRDFVEAHTSGSTGTPKPLRLPKDDMRRSARASNEFFGVGPDDTLLLPLSPDYIAGKMQIVRAVEAGCRVICEQPSNSPFPAVVASGARAVPLVPSQVDGFMRSPMFPLTQNIIIGGAPLSREAERRLLLSGANAFATYGMTETCSHVALRPLGSDEFVALPAFTFSVDSRGCLVIHARGFSFGTLVTNDVVSLTGSRRFRWLGRYDNVINSGGVKIHPEEIEKLISPRLPSGTRFYVTSRQSSRWGEEAVLVTDNPSVSLDLLPDLGIKKPKEVIVSEISLTSSGKIIRRKF